MTRKTVITLIAPSGDVLRDEQIQHVSTLAASCGFSAHSPIWLAEGEACDIPLVSQGDVNSKTLQTQLKALPIDAVWQPQDENRRKKLLISDMDSTIIQQECIDELADEMGIKPKVAEITEMAMRGELDFAAALRERVRLLKGLDVAALQRVYETRIHFMPGARELVATMRKHGAYCMLVSGGFTYFTSKVRDALGFNSDSANILEVAEGCLSGTVMEPILDKEAKLYAMKEAAFSHDIRLVQCLAIGDGANDLPMLLAAGMGIAYHAKPAVAEAASASIRHSDLRAALYVQGYRKEEIIGNWEG